MEVQQAPVSAVHSCMGTCMPPMDLMFGSAQCWVAIVIATQFILVMFQKIVDISVFRKIIRHRVFKISEKYLNYSKCIYLTICITINYIQFRVLQFSKT
jgi:hypothetical protein